jgi:hypothetical protein
MADAVDIKAASRHVRGYQKPYLAASHIGDGAVARALGHVAVEGGCGMPLAVKLLGHGIGVPLGCGEDNSLGQVDVGNEMLKQAALVAQVVRYMKTLLYLLKGGFFAGDFDPHRLFQKPLRQFGHGVVHSGGKHHGLPVGRGGGGDPVHILTEAHIEHAISLIENQNLQAGQIDSSPVEMVY